jgi:hypothetical protein
MIVLVTNNSRFAKVKNKDNTAGKDKSPFPAGHIYKPHLLLMKTLRLFTM